MKHLIVIAGVLGALIGAGAALERTPEAPREEVYNEGVAACRFIADEFGDAALRRVLESNEPTFGQRVHAVLGVEFDEFTRRQRAWMERTAMR